MNSYFRTNVPAFWSRSLPHQFHRLIREGERVKPLIPSLERPLVLPSHKPGGGRIPGAYNGRVSFFHFWFGLFHVLCAGTPWIGAKQSFMDKRHNLVTVYDGYPKILWVSK